MGIETEDVHLKLSERRMREVLQLCGVEISEDANEEKLLELLRQHQHKLAEDDEASKCKVCMERVIDCVFLNCGHLMTCSCCGEKLVSSSHYTVNCPICQKQISRVAKIYTT